jgi:hypothetical protein
MADTINPDMKQVIKQTVNAFANLLKEFPKNAAEDFIYDASTLSKIEDADNAVSEMATLFQQDKTSFGETETNRLKESYHLLTLLMDELPKDPTDEFLYDRTIHRQVENAREAVEQLSRIIA